VTKFPSRSVPHNFFVSFFARNSRKFYRTEVWNSDEIDDHSEHFRASSKLVFAPEIVSPTSADELTKKTSMARYGTPLKIMAQDMRKQSTNLSATNSCCRKKRKEWPEAGCPAVPSAVSHLGWRRPSPRHSSWQCPHAALNVPLKGSKKSTVLVIS